MKSKLITLLSVLLLGVALGQPDTKIRIPAEPIGVLTAYPTKVPYDPLHKNEPAAHVQLNYMILHPREVGDAALIKPPGLIYLKDSMFVSVRVIGVDPLQTKPIEASISINDQVYRQMFYGTVLDTRPQDILYSKKIEKNATVSIGVRSGGNGWGEFYSSSRDLNVRAFVNGDVLPMAKDIAIENFPAYLRPLTGAGGKLNLGPLDILFIADLETIPVGKYRDAAFLVTLSTKNQNNGHGNNLDGIDPSNPGRGVGGPTGLNNTGTYEDIELRGK